MQSNKVKQPQLELYAPARILARAPTHCSLTCSSDWKCLCLGLVAHGLDGLHLWLGNFLRGGTGPQLRRLPRRALLSPLLGRFVFCSRLVVVGTYQVGSGGTRLLQQIGAAAFRT